ncbi:hypothetical protein [Pantoea agglomerans]
MTAQDQIQKSIQQANQKERHHWRHARWLIRVMQIAIFLYLLYPIVVWVHRAL